MKTYRMQSLATLCFDVVADTEEEAKKKAQALLDRLDDGVDVENVDTEDELVSAVVYPDSITSPARGVTDLTVLDVEEDEEDDSFTCDECGETIPDSEPSMVNASHGEACSLNPKNTAGRP